MATTRIIPMHVNKGKTIAQCLTERTDYAKNPYAEMCRIAKGKFAYCPVCGAKYAGCQIEGVDFDKCDPYETDWIMRGLNT